MHRRTKDVAMAQIKVAFQAMMMPDPSVVCGHREAQPSSACLASTLPSSSLCTSFGPSTEAQMELADLYTEKDLHLVGTGQ